MRKRDPALSAEEHKCEFHLSIPSKHLETKWRDDTCPWKSHKRELRQTKAMRLENGACRCPIQSNVCRATSGESQAELVALKMAGNVNMWEKWRSSMKKHGLVDVQRDQLTIRSTARTWKSSLPEARVLVDDHYARFGRCGAPPTGGIGLP